VKQSSVAPAAEARLRRFLGAGPSGLVAGVGIAVATADMVGNVLGIEREFQRSMKYTSHDCARDVLRSRRCSRVASGQGELGKPFVGAIDELNSAC
jgi:hypothetical protein